MINRFSSMRRELHALATSRARRSSDNLESEGFGHGYRFPIRRCARHCRDLLLLHSLRNPQQPRQPSAHGRQRRPCAPQRLLSSTTSAARIPETERPPHTADVRRPFLFPELVVRLLIFLVFLLVPIVLTIVLLRPCLRRRLRVLPRLFERTRRRSLALLMLRLRPLLLRRRRVLPVLLRRWRRALFALRWPLLRRRRVLPVLLWWRRRPFLLRRRRVRPSLKLLRIAV